MKKQANFGHVLTMITIILGLVVTPLIVWGVSIEKQNQKHSDKIEVIEKNLEKKEARMEYLFGKLDDKLGEFIDRIHAVNLELQNKQNREE